MPNRPPVHRPVWARPSGQDRKSPDKRGYDHRWKRFRLAFLSAHPLCLDCEDRGVITAADEVHHLRRIADYPQGRLDPANCRSLCSSCHSARTARGE